MKKEVLKHQISVYLSTVLLIEVASYIITNFAYMSGAMTKFVSQVSFYTVAVFMPFMWGWVLFGAAYVVVRKCRNCGSKNIRYAFSEKGFVCDDCDYVYEPTLKNAKILLLSASILLLFIGPSFLLGIVLAGEELSKDLIGFSILLSSLMPSVLAEILYSSKLSNSTFVKEHKMLGSILSLISLFAVPILTLIVYWEIIFEILKVI